MSCDARSLYLDLMERCLINTIYRDPPTGPGDLEHYEEDIRIAGMDWPSCAHSMIGYWRMRNLREAAETVIQEKIPGDFLEAGVWRGGAAALMRAVIKAYGDAEDRHVWLADSFVGLPKPDADRYPADEGDTHHQHTQLAVDLDTVKDTFMRYGLLDERVCFLPGWFRETLPVAPVRRLALLRVDADMYESTFLALEHLYDRLSPAGYVIVDDYGVVPGCRRAVDDFRQQRAISSPLIQIDQAGVYWRKND